MSEFIPEKVVPAFKQADVVDPVLLVHKFIFTPTLFKAPPTLLRLPPAGNFNTLENPPAALLVAQLTRSASNSTSVGTL
jgi:hypothetical protein